MYRDCCFPDCERTAASQLELPLCSKHARAAYLAVKDLVDSASVSVVASTAKATGTARPFAGKRPGLVYFARMGECIKIGFTTNLHQRMSTLQPDEVLATMPGTMRDEKALHHKFGPLWIEGEMFRSDGPLLEFIEAVKAA